jgi:hypothetical protein
MEMAWSFLLSAANGGKPFLLLAFRKQRSVYLPSPAPESERIRDLLRFQLKSLRPQL